MHPLPGTHRRLLVAAAVGAFALSGGFGVIGAGVANAASSGSATVHFSNASARSAACKANNIQAIFITVSDVKGHTSGKGGGWHDFTPTLSQEPFQVNLLDSGAEDSEKQFTNTDDCLLASVGDDNGIPPGKYQQLRVLVDVSGNPPADNACASLGPNVFNCVELTDTTLHELTIPSGSQSGIKIPSTKIAKGGLTISPGQAVDLDIDIDGCRSIVVTGGGHGKKKKPPHGSSYKLKPVLQAGEVTLNSIISGQVVVGTNSNGTVSPNDPAVPVAGAAVWLENASSTASYTEGDPTPTATTVPVNNVMAMTSADQNGHFVFCPVPATTDSLELVAIAAAMPVPQGETSNPSDVTITKGVTSGPKGGMSGLVIPLVEPSSAPTATAQYTTASNANPPAAIPETLAIGMTQSDGTNQAPFPFANDSSVNPTTTGPSTNTCSCPTDTDCSCVTLDIPPDSPVIGSASGASYQQSSSTGEFSLLAQAAKSGAGSCSPNLLATAPNLSSNPLDQPTLSFQGCQ